MPIRDLPKSLRHLGKIRLGDQQATSGGKLRPAKLECPRLTSPNRELLDRGAEVYGGEVRQWEGAPGEGQQFELYTTTPTLDVIIPPGDGSFSQFYEMWSAGGCARRCDGYDEQISGGACACPADPEARKAEAAKGKACKITTRLMVILPKLPDLGVWMLETHGWYAAVELGAFMEFLARRAPGQFVEAKLRVEQRTVKRQGKTQHFAVPVIELPQATAGELLSGVPAPRELSAATPSAVDPETGEVYDAEFAPFDETNEKIVSADVVRAFVLKLKDAGFDDKVRAAIVHRATRGRTESSRAVLVTEWPMMERVYRALLDGKLAEVVEGDAVRLAVVESEAAAS